jgi:hypothetical protein
LSPVVWECGWDLSAENRARVNYLTELRQGDAVSSTGLVTNIGLPAVQIVSLAVPVNRPFNVEGFLEACGLIGLDSYASGGDYALTHAGRRLADQILMQRTNLAVRRQSAEDAVLYWATHRGQGRGSSIQDYIHSNFGHFWGLRFSWDEVASALETLEDRRWLSTDTIQYGRLWYKEYVTTVVATQAGFVEAKKRIIDYPQAEPFAQQSTDEGTASTPLNVGTIIIGDNNQYVEYNSTENVSINIGITVEAGRAAMDLANRLDLAVAKVVELQSLPFSTAQLRDAAKKGKSDWLKGMAEQILQKIGANVATPPVTAVLVEVWHAALRLLGLLQ